MTAKAQKCVFYFRMHTQSKYIHNLNTIGGSGQQYCTITWINDE